MEVRDTVCGPTFLITGRKKILTIKVYLFVSVEI